MKKVNIFLMAVVLFTAMISGCGQSNNSNPTLAIVHVNLIPMTAEAVLPDRTVLIEGDRITAIGDSSDVKIPRGAQVIDGMGAYAEYVAIPENILVKKPANISFEQAAAVPQAAVVALQGLRNNGQIQAGDKVLVNGASGGVGTFAVQIAKAFDAKVTGVCGAQNLDLVRAIGADHVIDYKNEDFTQSAELHDLIFDIVANRSVSDYMRVLNTKGRYVACAFNPAVLFLGGLISKSDGKKASSLVHKPNQGDLIFMKELLETGKVIPVIDRCYPLQDVPEAMGYLDSGQHRGKVVITVHKE